MAGRIEGKVRAVALPEKELEIPPIRLKTFIESLDDDLLDRLMMLMTRIRDIKACRDSSYQVVEGRFEREVIRSEDSYTGVLASITSDFYDFIKNETVVLNILKGMDFRELTMLLNYLEYFRAEKFMQGMVRGQ
ncbi:MAG: hypothetical protein ACD_65C00112G0001 [uncultured bacterium]|nr:MAG: hypothetical protein ACD_65C00112G0001 [uncultured bacterium]